MTLQINYVKICIRIIAISDSEFLRPIPDCMLGYTLATHKSLYKVSHLLPENTVVGNNDVIPGLYDGDTSGNVQYKLWQLYFPYCEDPVLRPLDKKTGSLLRPHMFGP